MRCPCQARGNRYARFAASSGLRRGEGEFGGGELILDNGCAKQRPCVTVRPVGTPTFGDLALKSPRSWARYVARAS